MRRHLLALLAAALVVAAGAGVAVARSPARLAAVGPTAVRGTEATSVFDIGDRTIRQVRYRDRGTLVYLLGLHNPGAVPLRVEGLALGPHQPKLFGILSLSDESGATVFSVPPGATTRVRLRMRMQGCESLSARAGSFATRVGVATTRAALVEQRVVVTLPEQLHTGSPREAFCPRATASSRPPG